MGIYREAAERIGDARFACHAIHDALGVPRSSASREADAFSALFAPPERGNYNAWSVWWVTDDEWCDMPTEKIEKQLMGYRILALLLMDAIAESEK